MHTDSEYNLSYYAPKHYPIYASHPLPRGGRYAYLRSIWIVHDDANDYDLAKEILTTPEYILMSAWQWRCSIVRLVSRIIPVTDVTNQSVPIIMDHSWTCRLMLWWFPASHTVPGA
jgi:hypothetical protein